MATLGEEFHDLMSGEFDDTPAYKLNNVQVVRKYDARMERRWPGKHKNVHVWVELENGKAVGWNENPSVGYSYPVMAMPKGEQ